MKLIRKRITKGQETISPGLLKTHTVYESGEVLSFKNDLILCRCLGFVPPNVVWRSGKVETYLESYSLEY